MAILKRGLAGEPVKILQAKLGVEADGKFGPATEAALKKYQKANDLAVDGIAGPDTFSEMGLHELILLRVGSKGETVKKLQMELGITADGIFGSGTAAAVKSFQEKNGLIIDGMAGPATLAKMDIFEDVTDEVAEKSFLGSMFGASSTSSSDDAAKSDEAEQAPKNSIWSTITKIFS